MRCVYDILLSAGTWGHRVDEDTVRTFICDTLDSADFRFLEPDDSEVMLQIEVTTAPINEEEDFEARRDRIAYTFIKRFQPEYESMVEVEALYV
jgi:hypothetical protein